MFIATITCNHYLSVFKFQGPIITVPIKESRKPNGSDDWISKTIFDSKVCKNRRLTRTEGESGMCVIVFR